MGDQSQAVNIWGEKALVDLHTMSASAQGPREGLAISLRLTQEAFVIPKSLKFWGPVQGSVHVICSPCPPPTRFFLNAPVQLDF